MFLPVMMRLMMNVLKIFIVFLVFLSLLSCSPTVSETARGTSSVVDFELSPVARDSRWIIAVPNFQVRSGTVKLGGKELADQDRAFYTELGSGVADIFVTEAFRSEQFRITERAELDKVLLEQDLASSGRVDQKTAAEVGQITGAELIVLGSLSQFSLDSTGGAGGILGIFGGSSETVTVKVTVDVRFVNAVTAEVEAIGIATSEVSQTNVEIDFFNIIQGLKAGRSGTSIVDIAIRNAIRGAINEAAASLPEK